MTNNKYLYTCIYVWKIFFCSLLHSFSISSVHHYLEVPNNLFKTIISSEIFNWSKQLQLIINFFSCKSPKLWLQTVTYFLSSKIAEFGKAMKQEISSKYAYTNHEINCAQNYRYKFVQILHVDRYTIIMYRKRNL